MKALIFDCDGVLVDTERDGHRVAFNDTFRAKGLDIEWDVEFYGDLLKIAGGKERMRHFFNTNGWPAGVSDQDTFVKSLHLAKTERFMEIIASGNLPLRPGVARLVDEAISAGIDLAVCSTSNEKAVNRIAEVMLGEDRKKHFKGIFAGDIVSKKKPSPEIYELASRKMDIKPGECVVVEDSRNGLLAAKSAHMHCVITKSSYTGDEDFKEADLVVNSLGNDGPSGISITDLQKLTQ